MTATVHQLLPSYSVGDAIGGAVLRTRDILRRAGFHSEVFARHWDRRLEAAAASGLLARARDQDALIYHLSIGSPVADTFAAWPGRRVIVYHNITPRHFYEGTSEEVAYWLERGRAELRRLVPLADLVIGVSAFNLAECLPFSPRATAVVPVPIDLDRLRPRPSRPESPPRILAVGRLAPNKRLDTLIRALAALRATELPDARLVLVGNSFDTGAHVGRLRRLADQLGVAGAVEMSGTAMADADLGDEYARASVLAVSSAHEGFCVPLLEAMAFDVPIVALDAAAIPGTLGDAGLLLPGRDPLLWAACLARAAGDAALRRDLTLRGRTRLGAFAPAAVERQLLAALAGIGVRAAEEPR